MELYHPRGSSYELCAVGIISLKSFLSRDQPKNISGLLNMVTQNDNHSFATVHYNITIKTELAEALVAQKVDIWMFTMLFGCCSAKFAMMFEFLCIFCITDIL